MLPKEAARFSLLAIPVFKLPPTQLKNREVEGEDDVWVLNGSIHSGQAAAPAAIVISSAIQSMEEDPWSRQMPSMSECGLDITGPVFERLLPGMLRKRKFGGEEEADEFRLCWLEVDIELERDLLVPWGIL